MERGYFLKALLVLSIIWLAGCAEGGGSATQPASPNAFLSEAAEAGTAEIQMASLALTRTQNPGVRGFAQQIIADHTVAFDEAKAIAGKKSAQLPLELNSRHKSLVNNLTRLQAAEFDREYLKAMVEDHEKDVKAFELQSQKGADEEVKNFAARTLPTLQKHLQMAREMQNKMK